jgi:IclR family acetate operon transcriptional repressor
MKTVDGSRPAPQYPIESVDNALRILLLFEDRKSLRLTDVSRFLEVASSTAHRLLAALQYRGFVSQNPVSKEYEPGSALTSIASSVMRQIDIRGRAHPILERLSAMLGETVHLGRLDGRDVYFLDSIESPRAVRVASRLGMTMPAHCTSTGKALLATLPAADIRRLYPREKLPGLTAESIQTRTELEGVLDLVREAGYATSREESEEGVSSVSVSLGAIAGSLFALNVSAPTYRMSESVRDEIVSELHGACKDITSFFF